MGNTQAIGRRRRVLRRVNERAQRRFHAAFDAGVITDAEATATKLYLEAERLMDAVMFPEVHALPVVQLEDILASLRYETLRPVLAESEMRGQWGDR